MATLNVEKYGEWITHNGKKYLLTNYRAVVNDFEQYGDKGIDLRKRFNTEEECEIIKEHFKVFLFKVDFPTRSQMVRHRISWQELSRRYVSGSRVPFEFYISEKIKCKVSKYQHTTPDGHFQSLEFTTEDINSIALNHYYNLLDIGVKPQEARRVIPQSAYTQIWGAFMPSQLENYFKLRLDEHSQWEIRMVSKAMQELINGRK